MPDTKNQNLGSLFLSHAQGYVTERALEERRVRTLKYLSKHKYTISDETANELFKELEEIARKLDE